MAQCKAARYVAVVFIWCVLFLHISQRAAAADVCGNNIAEKTERCDGTDLKGKTCKQLKYKNAQGLSQSYIGGTLLCTSCGYNVSKCTKAPAVTINSCGNGDIDAGEQCDWKGMGGATCQSLGFDGGKLNCNGYTCMFNTNKCYKCGDGKLDATEQCDGTDKQSATCYSLGFYTGKLACTVQCEFDMSLCKTFGQDPYALSPPTPPLQLPVCGNWKLDAGEVCDTKQLATKSNKALCQSAGYWGGAALCKPDCSGYGESGCFGWGSDQYGTPQSPNYQPACNNGALDVNEVCDLQHGPSSKDGKTCQQLGYFGGYAVWCKSDCSGYSEASCFGWGNDQYGTPQSPNYEPKCGNKYLDVGEVCDPQHAQTKYSPDKLLCKTLGYFGGKAFCKNDCSGYGGYGVGNCFGWGDDPYGKPPQ